MKNSNLSCQEPTINSKLINDLQKEAVKTIKLQAENAQLTGKTFEPDVRTELMAEGIYLIENDETAKFLIKRVRFINSNWRFLNKAQIKINGNQAKIDERKRSQI